MDTTTNINKDLKNLSTQDNSIEFSETSKSYKCKICKQFKFLDNFHKLEIKVGNNILKQEYFTILCKDCLLEEHLYWNNNKELKIDQSKLNLYFFQKQKEEFIKEHKISIDNLIQRPKAMEILSITDKNWIKEKVSMGLLKEYTFISKPGDFETRRGQAIPVIEKYYEQEQLKLLKYIKDNGFLTLRTKPSIRDGAEFIHNPPYFIQGSENRQYLFSNKTENKRVCTLCLKITTFEDFDKNCNTESGLGNRCSECVSKESKERWQNLDKNIKKERTDRVRQWMKDNVDKVKLHRKIFNGKFENRLKRNIRKRVSSIFNKVKDSYWYNIYMNDPSFQVSLSDFGCSKKELVLYLESKLLEGMTRENYGPGYEVDKKGKPVYDKNGNLKKIKQWQVDHIKAVSSFNLLDPEEIKKINHYTNLLPMWAKDNNEKSGKTELCPILDKEFLEKYKELEVLIKKKDNIEHGNKSMLEMQDREEFI